MGGAGVIISPDGTILTAAHVVGMTGSLKVTFKLGRSFKGIRVAANKKHRLVDAQHRQ